MNQGAAVGVDHIAQKTVGRDFSQRRVFVYVAEDFSARHPKVVHVPEQESCKMRLIVPKRYATSTLVDSASCVPWLAAEGPLAYTPENPPATDYLFQYRGSVWPINLI
jgi:hypothetical protein